jgi:hypothetical protein
MTFLCDAKILVLMTKKNGFSHLKDLVQYLTKRNEFKPKELSLETQALLRQLYAHTIGPAQSMLLQKLKSQNSVIPPPVLVSFHPKLSLLNNNVHETLLAVKIAEKTQQIPLWIPYLYDTATHSAAEGGKIRAPTYAYLEGKFLTLRAAAKIRGNIIRDEKPIQKKELDTFFQELSDWLGYQLGVLQNHLNPYNFGHALFDLKLRVMKYNRKTLLKELEGLKNEMFSSMAKAKNLGESLGLISQMLFHKLGIPINLVFIEPLLPELINTLFPAILSTPQVKEDPSILEGLFVHYDYQSKNRTPILYTGDSFLAMDDNAKRIFDGDLSELTDSIAKGTILPTGPMLILMFSALGCQLTIGGMHTTEYYPEYLDKADQLLTNTPYAHDMQVLGYSGLRYICSRSLMDILSVSRVLEKVGSRTIASTGKLCLPRDVVDHLNFLAGPNAVPLEYKPILENIFTENPKNVPKSVALDKEIERFKLIDGFNKVPLDQIKSQIPALKPFFIKLPLEDLSPERIKLVIEDLWEDSKSRVDKMRLDIAFEQHILGGKLTKNPQDMTDSGLNEFGEEIPFEELYDGLWIRSKRVPTLLEMVLYGSQLDLPLESPIDFQKPTVSHYVGYLKPISIEKDANIGIEKVFSDFKDVFEYLIPDSLLPSFLRK